MNPFRLAIIAVVALLLAAGVGAASAAGDQYLCYRTKPARAARGLPPFPAFAPRSGDAIVDAFGSFATGDQHRRDLKKVIGWCAPVNGEAGDGTTHLDAYAVTRTRTVPRQPSALVGVREMADEFGSLRLGVRGADRLLVPATAEGGVGGAPAVVPTDVDAFACYPARVARLAGESQNFTRRTLVVHDELGARTLQLTGPTRVCAPTDVNGADVDALTHPGHLVCYRARRARTAVPEPPFEKTVVSTYDAFGPAVLATVAIEELCVPATKDPPHPTTTPLGVPSPRRTPTPRLPTFTPLRTVTPTPTRTPTRTRTPKLVRTATPKPVRTATPSPTPTLTGPPVRTATPTVTRTPPPTRSATPRPTRSPTPTLSPTPVGTPQRFIVQPAIRSIQKDATANFTAIAEFRNGAQQNYTQKVTWKSSNDGVADVSNEDGTRGRATGHRLGTVTISVRDPVSGKVSAKADSATLTVLGALEGLELTPSQAALHVGDFAALTATAHFAGGTTQNYTQKVAYTSSNPAVVAALNTPGNRSAIQVLGVGTAIISAKDPDTGITSTASDGDVTVTVTP